MPSKSNSKNMGTSAKLTVDVSQALENIAKLAASLKDLQRQFGDDKSTFTVRVAFNKQDVTQSAQNTAKVYQDALNQVGKKAREVGEDLAKAMGGAIGKPNYIRQLEPQIQQARTLLDDLRDRTIAAADAAGLFEIQWGQALPAIRECQEAVKQVGAGIGEWDEILEGEVIDEFGQLRSIAVDTGEKIVDYAEKDYKAMERFGKSVKGVGDSIESVGKTWQNVSTTMYRGLASLGKFTLSMATMSFGGLGGLISESVDQIKDLELAEVGFRNQFSLKETGFDSAAFIEQIKEQARTTIGVGTGDLASSIASIAPVAQNSQQAFDVAMGLVKAISYGGGDPSQELNYVIKNVRDVLAKGKANAMDINQFMRAIPVLPQLFSQMGETQFVQNGQLSITADNIDGFLDALARLNQSGNAAADSFEEMRDTLSGMVEETKETMVQSIISTIEDTGLLDLWKDFMRTGEAMKFFEDVTRSVANLIANFLQSINIGEVLTTFFDALREIGAYAAEQILPALRDFLGLEKNANLTEVIKGLIGRIVEFAKGFVDGIKGMINVLKPFKDALQGIVNWLNGMFGGNLSVEKIVGAILSSGVVAGFFTKLGGSLISNIGSLISISARNAQKGEVSGIGSLLSGLFGGNSGTAGNAGGISGIFKALGLFVGGQTLAAGLGSLSDSTEGAVSGLAKIGQYAADLGSTFFSVNSVLGPIPALLVTFGKGIIDLTTEVQKAAEAEKQRRLDQVDESVKQLQNAYAASAQQNLRDAGLYEIGQSESEDAWVQTMEWVRENINAGMKPQEAQALIAQKYKEFYATNITGTDLQTMLDTIEGEYGTDQYLRGPNKLTSELANQNTAKLKSVFDQFVSLGLVDAYTGGQELTGQEILNLLKRGGYTIGSLEHLNAISGYLGENQTYYNSILGKEVGSELYYSQTEKDNRLNTINAMLQALGKDPVSSLAEAYAPLAVDPNRAATEEEFLTMLGFQTREINGQTAIYVPAVMDMLNSVEAANEALNQLSANTNGIFTVENDQLNLHTNLVIDNDPFGNTDNTLRTNSLYQYALGAAGIPHDAIGGLVKPIYRAVGGAIGSDTVPAMLSPGEFVQKASAVQSAGLGVMEALNHGDLPTAFRLIGSKINSRIYNTTNGAVTNNRTNRVTNNSFIIKNMGRSARANTYYGVRNFMAR